MCNLFFSCSWNPWDFRVNAGHYPWVYTYVVQRLQPPINKAGSSFHTPNIKHFLHYLLACTIYKKSCQIAAAQQLFIKTQNMKLKQIWGSLHLLRVYKRSASSCLVFIFRLMNSLGKLCLPSALFLVLSLCPLKMEPLLWLFVLMTHHSP